jgi:hypothetical protein
VAGLPLRQRPADVDLSPHPWPRSGAPGHQNPDRPSAEIFGRPADPESGDGPILHTHMHSSQYGTLYGEGDYRIGIPKAIDAHGAAFVRTARACHTVGVG